MKQDTANEKLDDDAVLDEDGAEIGEQGEDDTNKVTQAGSAERPKEDALHLGDLAQTPQLREEANELKQCFSRYAFQSIGLCSLAFAGIFKFIPGEPIFGLGALSVLPVVYAVSWLGVYKYARSNRAFGYELYLERSRALPSEYCGRWKPSYRYLSWEEAIHAWRAVQPSLYRAIYIKSLTRPDRIRSQFARKIRGPVWFLPESEVSGAGAAWHPGRYLHNTLRFLYLIAWISILLLAVSMVIYAFHKQSVATPMSEILANPQSFHLPERAALPLGFWICLCAGVLASLITSIVMQKALQGCRRVRKGILSVYSCSVIWQAVVVAHFSAVAKSRQYKLSTAQLQEIVRSLKRKERAEVAAGNAEKFIIRAEPHWPSVREPDGFGLPGYSFWLAQEAASLAAHPLEINRWIFDRCAYQ